MFKKYLPKKCLLLFLLLFMFLNIHFLFENNLFATTSQEDRARLQAELNELEIQIKEYQDKISTTQKNKATLNRDISLLQSQINKKQLEIKQVDSKISSLSNQISDKNNELNYLNNTLSKQKKALLNTLKSINKFDDKNNFVNLFLSSNTISEYFENFDRIVNLQDAINKDVQGIQDTTIKVNKVKEVLQDNKESQIALKEKQKQEQKKISISKSEKDNLLKETKGQENLYKKQLSEKQVKAAGIRSRLFNFAGGNTKSIPFGDALKYAEESEKKTGTPAAFVLAILTQESALGANVGKCYLSDTTSGAGYNVNTKQTFSNVMKATRDLPVFLNITSRLGIDPLKTVISCPIPSAGGYGGAMGPAQFIPSTWKVVENRVVSNTGSNNPWNAKDAIFASSIYLSDLGANSDYLSQIKAACRYYGSGGTNCSYGKSVLSRIDKIQADIDYLKQYSQ